MYQRILVPLDGSPTSIRGLSEAIKLTKNQHGLLQLLVVAEEPVLDYDYELGTCGELFTDSVRKNCKNILKMAQDLVRAEDLVAETYWWSPRANPLPP